MNYFIFENKLYLAENKKNIKNRIKLEIIL